MAKLYFRHGAMGSAKTLNLLAVRHNYERQGKRVLLCKPALDVRYGDASVTSRSGLTYQADMLLEGTTCLDHEPFRGLHCILVDEAQFLSSDVVEQLHEITVVLDIPRHLLRPAHRLPHPPLRWGQAPLRTGRFHRGSQDDVPVL